MVGSQYLEGQTPLHVVRAMEGAKTFLDSSLLEVPWLWRSDSVRMKAKPTLESDDLRNHQKLVRRQLEVPPYTCVF
jgi:hypothetical protein